MHNNVRERVSRCFSNVFEGIRPEDISNANTSSLPAWDSMAHVTLLSLISEEFGFDFELEDFEQLISYALIVDYVEKRTQDG